MAIKRVKVHPAIGIARVGNSPDGFFVGPERLWELPDPHGGFKDGNGRVKRQAARFRVFAYHDDGSTEELTAADADITWTVHLANRKVASEISFDSSCDGASCIPTEPGTYTVTGTVFVDEAEVSGQAVLVVEPQPAPLARLELQPAEARVVVGAGQSYTARGVAEDGTELGDFTAATSFRTTGDGDCLGASCAPTEPGTYTVTGTVFVDEAEVSGQAVLVVEPQPAPLARLELQPAEARVVVGAGQSYTARGVAEDGTELGDFTAATSFRTTGDGDCLGASCAPTEPGTYTVTGTVFVDEAEVSGQAVLVVEPQPAPLARLELQPAEARVVVGAGQSYTARGVAEDGTELGDFTAATSFTTTSNEHSPADLIIDPGPRTLDGPDQRKRFDNGQIRFPGGAVVMVPLGEVRTDEEGRLLVLGGFGTAASPSGHPNTGQDNAGPYDDVSDGPVRATVRLHATGEELEAAGAWVIVGPPKFAPQLDSVITLHDAIFQMAVEQNWLTAKDRPSYTYDIHPILQRARTAQWVVEDAARRHRWADPVYDVRKRRDIFGRLRKPDGGGGDMPRLSGRPTLTKTQYRLMKAWKDDHFDRDWTVPPVPQAQVNPEGLDRAALQACVGASFAPGIEAGGGDPPPIIDPARYVGADDPMRLDHSAVSPGDISQGMVLPWQDDFQACSGWWPVPRPSEVIPQASATSTYLAWARAIADMVYDWPTLGFVIRQGNRYVEVGHSDPTVIILRTPHLNFEDVPQGPMGMAGTASLAIEFEVQSTAAAVTLEVEPGDGPGHLRLKLESTAVTVGPTVANELATAQLLVTYETGQVGERIADQVTVRDPASGRAWVVTITANTVARKATAVALLLDGSVSTLEDQGDAQSAQRRLAEAASILVDVMLEGDGVGLVRADQEAPQVLTVGPAGDPLDPARRATKDLLARTEPVPSTAASAGGGIQQGRRLLEATDGHDAKALLILTDARRYRTPRRSDTALGVNDRTFAVEFGTPQHTSFRELQAMSENNGGYLLATGPMTGGSRFMVQKDLLQILASIGGAEVVLNTDGVLAPGSQPEIPFQLTETDAGIEVILLTDSPDQIDFRLQTANGFLLEPWRAGAEPSMAWRLSEGVAYYRAVLPVELRPERYERAGTWRALLSIGRPRDGRPGAGSVGLQPATDSRRRLLPYSILVHAYSKLSLRASVVQSGFEPGSTVTIDATITEAGVYPLHGTSVWVEVGRPDGPGSRVVLPETEPGRFNGSFLTSMAGVYRCRIRASGRSRAGYPFQREQTLAAAVWRGGDRDAVEVGEEDD